jgi:hypothetical protein
MEINCVAFKLESKKTNDANELFVVLQWVCDEFNDAGIAALDG